MTGQQLMDATIAAITLIISSILFSAATWVVIFTLGFFVLLFATASRDVNSLIHWEHLILESETDRASPYKLGYLVGIIVATWLVIRISDAGNLSLDIFGAYLAYLLGGASVNLFKKRQAQETKELTDEQ